MDAAALIAALQRNAAVTTKEVTVPGVGTVHIRPSTIRDVETEAEGGSAAGMVSRRLIRLICDDTGNPLLDAANPDHVALIASQPESVLTALSQAARELNGRTDESSADLGNG